MFYHNQNFGAVANQSYNVYATYYIMFTGAR